MTQDQQTLEALRLLGVDVPGDFQRIQQSPTLEKAQELLQVLKDRVHKNHRKLAFELHPDRTGNDPNKTELFKVIIRVQAEVAELKLQQAPRLPMMPMIVVRYTGFGMPHQTRTNTTTTFTTASTAWRVVHMKPF